MVRIYNAKDLIEANRIVSFLKEEGIPSYVSGSGTGEYLQIAMGHSVFGMDISVMEEHEERARQIVRELLESDNSVCDEDKADACTDEDGNSGTGRHADGEANAGPDGKAKEQVIAGEDEETESLPWYRDQKITARAVVLVFAVIIILLGVLELAVN